MSTYVTVLKIQWYLKLAHMYLYWIHKNLYHGYKNLSVAAMKKQYFAICIKQFADVTAHVHSADENGQNLHAPQATTITTVLCIYTNEAKARVTITILIC
jgi:hypothetical protein